MFLDLERMGDEERRGQRRNSTERMKREAGKRCPDERELQTASQEKTHGFSFLTQE